MMIVSDLRMITNKNKIFSKEKGGGVGELNCFQCLWRVACC
jgi:hypothetical protein